MVTSFKQRFAAAFLIVGIPWFATLLLFGCWYSSDPDWWENIAHHWGYAHFREWGDMIMFISIPAAFVVWLVALAIIEFVCWQIRRNTVRGNRFGHHPRSLRRSFRNP